MSRGVSILKKGWTIERNRGPIANMAIQRTTKANNAVQGPIAGRRIAASLMASLLFRGHLTVRPRGRRKRNLF
jgi:hypothetical protein